MFRLVICTCVLIAGAPIAVGQEWARRMFDELSHDFGKVASGAKIDHEFELTNIYEEDIHIAGVRSSCGCTTPKVVKDTLKTYEKGAILATFNTRPPFQGKRSATLTVTIDEPFYAEVQLRVQGHTRKDIVLNPGGVELGAVDQGQAAEKSLEITYAGKPNWEIVEVRPDSNFLEAEVTETSRGNGRVSYDLKVRLKNDAPAGYIKEQLTLITNDSVVGEFPVSVEGRIVSEITVSPPSLFMGALKPGQKVSKQLVVQAKKPFKIIAIESDTEGFEFKTPETEKPVHLVPITFIAPDKAGKKTFKIRIQTDLGEGAVQELSAYCQILKTPEVSQSAKASE